MKDFNKRITKIRVDLLTEIEKVVGNRTINVFDEMLYVTDEQSEVRRRVEKINKIFVSFKKLDDIFNVDLGDIGTDDLISIYETVARN